MSKAGAPQAPVGTSGTGAGQGGRLRAAHPPSALQHVHNVHTEGSAGKFSLAGAKPWRSAMCANALRWVCGSVPGFSPTVWACVLSRLLSRHGYRCG